jgi:hypothetical protein
MTSSRCDVIKNNAQFPTTSPPPQDPDSTLFALGTSSVGAATAVAPHQKLTQTYSSHLPLTDFRLVPLSLIISQSALSSMLNPSAYLSILITTTVLLFSPVTSSFKYNVSKYFTISPIVSFQLFLSPPSSRAPSLPPAIQLYHTSTSTQHPEC